MGFFFVCFFFFFSIFFKYTIYMSTSAEGRLGGPPHTALNNHTATLGVTTEFCKANSRQSGSASTKEIKMTVKSTEKNN